MVSRINIFCVGFLFLLSTLTHAGGFQAHFDKSQVEYGKSVNLILSYSADRHDSSAPGFSSIDLSAIKAHFHVASQSEPQKINTTYQWKLRLYPQHVGRFIVPGLVLNDQTTANLRMTVTQAKDHKTDLPITVTFKVSNKTPWVREQISYFSKIDTMADLRQITIDTTEIKTLTIKPLKAIRSEQTGYLTGWQISVKRSGIQILDLPAIKIIRDGVVTHRFYPPVKSINVKALPVYVLSTIPVGKLEISEIDSSLLSVTDSLSTIRLRINSLGIPRNFIPSLISLRTEISGLKIYPTIVKQKAHSSHHGDEIITLIDIPYKLESQGFYTTQAQLIPYFDPVSGTLQHSRLDALDFISLNKWIITLISICLVVLGAWLVYRFIVLIRKHISHQRNKHKARQLFESATTKSELRQAMHFVSSQLYDKNNLTPCQWLELFCNDVNITDILNKQLNEFFYTNAANNADITSFSQRLVKMLG